MSGKRFADLLERTMGLNAASIGMSAVERAVHARVRARHLENENAYWDLLQGSREELQDLIEAVIVPETWFFRDPQAFAAMARAASAQCLKSDASRQLRLLSLPCSTGEEPYSMAMALLDAGLPSDRFRIDAIDICARSLSQAQLGEYGRNSFRGRDMAFRDRHFEPTARGHRIRDSLRASVHFSQGNIIDGGFLVGADQYDFIFCRNLLIYFDTEVQNRAVGVLSRLLLPQGLLFVGHSEAGLMPANGFASAKIPMAFAFHKTPASPAPSARPAAPRVSLKPKPTSVKAPAAKPFRGDGFKPEAAPTGARCDIDDLRRVADSGRFEEAARGCERHMRECGPSPDALLLLGLISDASGDASAAVRYYRKALYLDPANDEALGHLALALKNQGDHAGAKLLNDRMRRQDERKRR